MGEIRRHDRKSNSSNCFCAYCVVFTYIVIRNSGFFLAEMNRVSKNLHINSFFNFFSFKLSHVYLTRTQQNKSSYFADSCTPSSYSCYYCGGGGGAAFAIVSVLLLLSRCLWRPCSLAHSLLILAGLSKPCRQAGGRAEEEEEEEGE